jgi:hypothetical protein
LLRKREKNKRFDKGRWVSRNGAISRIEDLGPNKETVEREIERKRGVAVAEQGGGIK